MGRLLQETMARLGGEIDADVNYGSYQISAKIDTNHNAILGVLTDMKIVEHKTDALKLVIEAGYAYLLENFPEDLAYAMRERKDEIFEILREHEGD